MSAKSKEDKDVKETLGDDMRNEARPTRKGRLQLIGAMVVDALVAGRDPLVGFLDLYGGVEGEDMILLLRAFLRQEAKKAQNP